MSVITGIGEPYRLSTTVGAWLNLLQASKSWYVLSLRDLIDMRVKDAVDSAYVLKLL